MKKQRMRPISMMGTSKKAEQEYIQNWHNEDIMMNLIGFQEYENPFKNTDLDDDDPPEKARKK